MAAACPCPGAGSCRTLLRLGIGDLTRAHPRANFRCRRDRLGRVAPGRERAELLAVFVRDPSALVTALLSDVGEHGMPARACFGVVCLAIRAPTLDESEF